jgi:S-adenosyl-L-methionine hydrolase (adenosine-forming)
VIDRRCVKGQVRAVPIITLTTDFGREDWFVGTMKGVILGIEADATIVDLTHEVPRQDIRAGAFALAASYRFFPQGTIHVAVVDPGVGSARKAMAVRTPRFIFVGPDNGVLSWALRNEEVLEVRGLENERYFAGAVSRTFQGRDLFAPVAAWLSRGVKFSTLGPKLPALLKLPWPEPARTAGGWRGEIVYIDRYGNCVTNLPAELVPQSVRRKVVVKKRPIPLKDFYAAVDRGKPLAIASSNGFLEVAVNGGSAAKQLKLVIGSPLELR